MALKKVTWYGVGSLRALGIGRNRTRVVEGRLLTHAVYQSYGRHMVVQDARTSVVEHLGMDVSASDVSRLNPRGFSKSITTPDIAAPSVEEPLQEAPKPAAPARAAVEQTSLLLPDPDESLVEESSEEAELEAELEVAPSTADLISNEPETDSEPEAELLDESKGEEADTWQEVADRLQALRKSDLVQFAELHGVDATGVKARIIERLKDVDDLDFTLLD